MAGHGAVRMDLDGASGLPVAIVASLWHDEIMSGLLDSAVRTCEEAGITPTIVRVAGSFELPVTSLALARRGFAAVVALGVIIRGGTPHFEYVSAAAADGLMRVSLDTGVPIGLGVLTCDNEEQARDRAGLPGSREDKGREATEAAVATAVALRRL